MPRRKSRRKEKDDETDWFLKGSHTIVMDSESYDEEFGDIFGKKVPHEDEDDVWSDEDYLLMDDDDDFDDDD